MTELALPRGTFVTALTGQGNIQTTGTANHPTMALNVSAGPGIQVGDGASEVGGTVVWGDLGGGGTEAEATWHLQTLAGYRHAIFLHGRSNVVLVREGLPVLPRQRS